MQLLRRFLEVSLCMFTAVALAEAPKGEYLDGKASKTAVVLAHGQGLDPDGNVVGPLRRAIHETLGYHTLSLSMPTLPGARSIDLFEEYESTFPEAYLRIQAAIDFLRNEKGVEKIFLMGHSMGGRMTSAFFRKPFVSDRYVQVSVPGAKHDYKGYEKVVADAVNTWLGQQAGK